MSRKLIQDDEQYSKAQSALLSMAAKLDDPLSDMTSDERERTQMIYDRTAELMHYYRRGELVQMFPGLREQYRTLGWEWQEFDKPQEIAEVEQQEVVKHDDPPTPPPSPPQEPAQSKKPSLSAWLDD